MSTSQESEYEPINLVHLRGRISSLPVERELPSGDCVVECRVVVPRNKSLRTRKQPGKLNGDGTPRAEVDTLDLAFWALKLRKGALKLEKGQWVEIEGSVGRRFWKSPNGLSSRWQIEVSSLKRL